MNLNGSILITGGAGTMGREIIRRSQEQKWDCNITIFSTDAIKHAQVRARWPHVHSVIGDIRDKTTLYNVMAGKDIVIHAAAVKHVPVSEFNSIDTYQVNVEGSLNVVEAAYAQGVKHVIGISTDKACHAANAYGATKYLMEKIFQEYSRLPLPTQLHLVRYGNVLESTASVIEAWKNAFNNQETIKITNPEMTRFWLSPGQAVEFVELALEFSECKILIPKMKKLSIGKLVEYLFDGLKYEIESIPLRPGEKLHETLLTFEETRYVTESSNFFMLHSSIKGELSVEFGEPYTSENAPELTKEELFTLLKNE